MATRPQHGLLLLAGLLVCLQQTGAMPMHPDLLSFIKLPAASDPSEQLQQAAARKLQQEPLFEEGGGPFTFDGFGFGYGGLFPAGGFFDGFGVNIYNIIVRDLFNRNLEVGLGTSFPTGIDPFIYLPPEIGNLFNRDVAVLFGFDAVDRYIGQCLERATVSVGEAVDAGCVGPTYSVTVNGGECEILGDGSVECEEPFVELSETPFTCNLPYREAAELEGQSFQYNVEFGRERQGELGLPAGEYNFGAAVNVTTPYLGVSLATRILADDFGLQQWWQYLGALVLNELVRIQAALLSGDVDARIINVPQGRTGAAAGAPGPIAAGVASVADASSVLLDRIAQQMGISVADLSDGLNAVGLLPQQPRAAGNATAGEPQVTKAEGAPSPAPKAAPKPSPKAAPSPAPKPAPKAVPSPSPKPAPRAAPKPAPKSAPRAAPKPAPNPKAAPSPSPKPAPKPAPKPKAAPSPSPKPAAKNASEPKH